MTLSPSGLEEIRKSEALLLKAYQDTGGVWTIGYGHTGTVGGKPVGPGMTITKEQAEQLLANDTKIFENAIRNHVKVPLNQNQYDALVNFSYNIGHGAFKDSTLLKLLNQGNYQGAADQMLRWNKVNGEVVKGLTNRRERERAMFLGSEYQPNQRSNISLPTRKLDQMDVGTHEPQQYDYSTTKPLPVAQNVLQPQAIASFSSPFTPIVPNTTETVGQTQTDFTNPFTNAFNQINGELEPLQDIPKQSNRQKYQQQLAQAFGVQPEVNNGLPDYIGDLVRSIYDQTA